MNINHIARVLHEEVSTSFQRRRDTGYDGVFTVEIPVITGFRTSVQVRLEIDDTLSVDDRDAHRFPPDLPLADDWPYICRVTALPSPPFWGFLGSAPVADNVLVRIQVFALYGVKISAFVAGQDGKFEQMEKLVYENGSLRVQVDIDKMCRPECLPVTGEAINTDLSHPMAPVTGAQQTPLARKLSQFIVRHVPNGVDITWLGTQQTLSLRVAKPEKAEAGFVYYFNPEPRFGSDDLSQPRAYDDLLHILVLGEVTITLDLAMPLEKKQVMPKAQDGEDDVEVWGTTPLYDRMFVDPVQWDRAHQIVTQEQEVLEAGGDPYDLPDRVRPDQIVRPVEQARFFRVGRVDDVRDLPPYGAPFLIGTGEEDEARGNRVRAYLFKKPGPPPLLVKVAFDVIVGEIPFFGMAADYAEFNQALATGKDRWGDEVTDFELVLMGASILPVIGLPFEVVGQVSKVYRHM